MKRKLTLGVIVLAMLAALSTGLFSVAAADDGGSVRYKVTVTNVTDSIACAHVNIHLTFGIP